jgi:ABC-type transport system involved in Fe-S cluster assembly fused permease/ATPase subunit
MEPAESAVLFAYEPSRGVLNEVSFTAEPAERVGILEDGRAIEARPGLDATSRRMVASR